MFIFWPDVSQVDGITAGFSISSDQILLLMATIEELLFCSKVKGKGSLVLEFERWVRRLSLVSSKKRRRWLMLLI